MVPPLSLSNVLIVLFAGLCLRLVARQTAGRLHRMFWLALPPLLASANALALLAGVVDPGPFDDVAWAAALVLGLLVGRTRGKAVPLEFLPAERAVGVTQTADNVGIGVLLVALSVLDFAAAALEEPLLAPVQVAAGVAFCAGYFAGRAFMLAVRVHQMEHS